MIFNLKHLWTWFHWTWITTSFMEIDVAKMAEKKIKLVILDLDNTLSPIHIKKYDENVLLFLQKLKAANFRIVIASNNTKKRVEKYFEGIENYIDEFIWNAHKPFKKKFKHLANKYFVNWNEIVVIGDQILTDILLANYLKTKSFLVLPVWGNVSQQTKTQKIFRKMEFYIFRKVEIIFFPKKKNKEK